MTETAPEAPAMRRILAVYNSATDTPALRAAAGLADRHGAALTVLSCVEPPDDLAVLARVPGIPPDDLLNRLAEAQRRQMVDAIGEFRDCDFAVTTGKSFVEIIRHVLHQSVDMVVKRAEPLGGLQRFFFASTDQHLLRKCPCPVWLHVGDAATEPRTILAAVDVDDIDATEPATLAALNAKVIDTALSLAAGSSGTIHVLHAWEAMGEGLIWTFSSGTDARCAAERYVSEVEATRRRALEALLQPVMAARGAGRQTTRIVPRLIRGPARTVIAEQAELLGSDVIVMGTVARTGVGGIIIGNTAEDILNSIRTSVVAVKPPGFVSPLEG